MLESGDVYAWGQGQYGSTGLGTTDDVSLPKRVELGDGVVKVSTGKGHTAMIDNRGCVLMCGLNDYGQLGLGEKAPEMVL